MNRSALSVVRSLLDIYSSRASSRLVVLATMGTGFYLLVRGGSTGSPMGAIPFLVLLWANHQRFLDTVESLLARRGWLVLAVPLLVFASKFLLAPPVASDDLLRHLVSRFWPGGYAEMYVYASLPPFELYPAFDWLAGSLALTIGPAPAMWVFQAAAVGGFVVVFSTVGRRLTGDSPMRAVLVLVALVLVLQIMGSRLFLARPEIFMTIWALAAPLAKRRPAVAAWCVTGLALGAGYWLAVLYFPAAILLALGARRRLVLFAGLTLSWFVLWWWMTDGRLVEALMWTFEQVGRREPGIAISENASILNVVLMPQFQALFIGAAWAWSRGGGRTGFLLLAGYFLLSNQARYGGIVAPLLALYVLSGLDDRQFRWPRYSRSVATALGAMALSVLSNGVPRLAHLPQFALSEGAVVLTGLVGGSYSTTFANPGKVRVAPPFEIGALAPDVQRLVRDLDRGRLDCGALRRYAFTHVIEPTLSGPVPPCLRLEETRLGWRLWRVDPGVVDEREGGVAR